MTDGFTACFRQVNAVATVVAGIASVACTRRMPVSRVRLSISALMATSAELPDIAIAATSGLMVIG